MSTATKSELKELKDLIIAQSGQLRIQSEQLAVIQSDIVNLKVSTDRVEEKMNSLESRMSRIEGTLLGQQPYVQKIPDLAERVGELKNWKQIGLTLSGALLGALITYLAKSSNP
jgi:chromosome segregation ATPase